MLHKHIFVWNYKYWHHSAWSSGALSCKISSSNKTIHIKYELLTLLTILSRFKLCLSLLSDIRYWITLAIQVHNLRIMIFIAHACKTICRMKIKDLILWFLLLPQTHFYLKSPGGWWRQVSEDDDSDWRQEKWDSDVECCKKRGVMSGSSWLPSLSVTGLTL